MDTQNHPPVTTRQVCDALGRGYMSKRLETGLPVISDTIKSGKFPARWYVVIKGMCAEAGIECPNSLFTFIDGALPD